MQPLNKWCNGENVHFIKKGVILAFKKKGIIFYKVLYFLEGTLESIMLDIQLKLI